MTHWKKLPLFKKAMEIQKLVNHIALAVDNSEIALDNKAETEMIKLHIQYLRESATIIPAKIAGASGTNMPYDIKMENAAIIRKAARELLTDATGLEINGFKDLEYLDLLRKEIEDFRILYAEWVKTFDCWNYTIDRWGLFNPPGVSYDDKDQGDDLPFNPDGFD